MINRKGSVFDVFTWMIVGLILIVFFAGIMYGFSLVTEQMQTIEIDFGGGDNFSTIVDDTFVQLNNALGDLRLIAFVIIISQIIAIFLFNYFSRSNPVFFVVYWLISIPAIIFSAYISNQYETILYDTALSGTLGGFTATNFIILNLPYFSVVITLIGAFFLFLGILRDREIEGGIVT